MKKLFIFALFILTVALLMSGCSDTKTNGNSTEQTETDTIEDIIPSTAKPVDHITIKSGTNSVKPLGSLIWSQEQNPDGTYNETEVKICDVVHLISGKAGIPQSDIPTIYLDQKITYYAQVNGHILKTTLLTPDGDSFKKKAVSFDSLSFLREGTYYVTLDVKIGGNCNPDTPQNHYRYEDVFRLVVEKNSQTPSIYMMRYPSNGGWGGISTKRLVDSPIVTDITDQLKNIKKTGETEKKISDEVFSSDDNKAEPGTMWIETNEALYRISPGYEQICLVETHYGEGKILEMTDKLRTDLINAWQYAPYNTYTGTYKRGDEKVELKNVFSAEYSVEITVEEIKLDTSYENKNNSITLKLVSPENKTVEVYLTSQQSADNIGTMDSKSVTLTKDIPQEITFDFWGWHDITYGVNISVENTRIRLIIAP